MQITSFKYNSHTRRP